MLDLLVVGLVFISSVFGLIRGITSQIMALVGLVAAYYWAPNVGSWLAPTIQQQLGCSRFMAEKASVFFIAVFIYIAFRLIGLGVEKLVIARVREFKGLNRMGGAILGGVKGALLVAVLFFFLALLPKPLLQGWAPKLSQSYSYRWAAKYNPMGNQKMLERMREFRTSMKDPVRKEHLKKDPEVKNILTRFGLRDALQDERFVKSLEDGDFDQLRSHEKIEELMKDDQLGDLLAKLDQKSAG